MASINHMRVEISLKDMKSKGFCPNGHEKHWKMGVSGLDLESKECKYPTCYYLLQTNATHLDTYNIVQQ